MKEVIAEHKEYNNSQKQIISVWPRQDSQHKQSNGQIAKPKQVVFMMIFSQLHSAVFAEFCTHISNLPAIGAMMGHFSNLSYRSSHRIYSLHCRYKFRYSYQSTLLLHRRVCTRMIRSFDRMNYHRYNRHSLDQIFHHSTKVPSHIGRF